MFGLLQSAKVGNSSIMKVFVAIAFIFATKFFATRVKELLLLIVAIIFLTVLIAAVADITTVPIAPSFRRTPDVSTH